MLNQLITNGWRKIQNNTIGGGLVGRMCIIFNAQWLQKSLYQIEKLMKEGRAGCRLLISRPPFIKGG